jgi:hypothetical protein
LLCPVCQEAFFFLRSLVLTLARGLQPGCFSRHPAFQFQYNLRAGSALLLKGFDFGSDTGDKITGRSRLVGVGMFGRAAKRAGLAGNKQIRTAGGQLLGGLRQTQLAETLFQYSFQCGQLVRVAFGVPS